MQCSRHGHGLSTNAISDVANHSYKSSPVGGDTLHFLKIILASHLIVDSTDSFSLTQLKNTERSITNYILNTLLMSRD